MQFMVYMDRSTNTGADMSRNTTDTAATPTWQAILAKARAETDRAAAIIDALPNKPRAE